MGWKPWERWIVSSEWPGGKKEQRLIQMKKQIKRGFCNQFGDGNLSAEDQASV
jgi:hypothetical protein